MAKINILIDIDIFIDALKGIKSAKELPLLTRNKKHFEHIEEITLLPAYEDMYGQGQTRGRTAITKIPAAITQNCAGIVIDTNKAEPYFVWYYLQSIYELIRGQDYRGGGVPHLNLEIVKNIEIPLSPLETQRQIVEKLDW